jgi:transposase
MESSTHQIGASTVTLASEGLTITIARRHWSARHWAWLVQALAQVLGGGLAWVLAPTTRAAVTAAAGRPTPRWKPMLIDGLSYLLFVLLIPVGHPLRRLYAAFDWTTIDAQCAAVYQNQERGAPAYAPQVLFRILVLMFVSGTPFESATLARLQTDVAWRWFVGVSLLAPLPTAGSLSRFRTRLGVARFEALLVELILVCDRQGLLGQLEAYFDMTGVAASASQVTPYERAVILAKALSAYLAEETAGPTAVSPEQIAAIVLEVLREKHPSLQEVQPAQIVASQTQLEAELAHPGRGEPAWWPRLRQASAQVAHTLGGVPQAGLAHLRAVARQLAPSLPQAFGNPDAAVGHTRSDGTLCGYRSGLLVDAKRRIIVAVIVVALNCVEAPAALQALDKYYAIFGRYPKRLGLDSAFDRAEVHAYCEAHDIAASITVRSRPGAAGVFHADAFVWNDQEQLTCPNGAPMTRVKAPDGQGVALYRASGACAACPLLNQCLTAKQQQRTTPQRELRINPVTHQRAQRSRERSRSPEGRAVRRRRFGSEGLFGHLNTYHNGDKAPYRNAQMDTIAQLLVAFVANLETLAAAA